jgi:asparagine synthase (glutamine-hydrolysing)
MCGIVGIVGKYADEERLTKMLAVQNHRGPDFTGTFVDDSKIALGHNRLSIIDLSDEANQPMWDNSGRYAIVFNGEIYNYIELRESLKGHYRFRTHSDTEVLLAAYLEWGKEMLERLNGMFAFVIYDRVAGELFGARDRFGVKPLYYTLQGESFYFASEIKALEAGGIRLSPNEKVWSEYLLYGSYGKPNESFWHGICQIEAGHYFCYDGTLKTTRWYDFAERVGSIKASESTEALQASYEDLLTESVSLRFRADVRIGFNLSGGLDSSTLLAMVERTHPRESNIEAFTFYTGDARYDEDLWVEKMLAHRPYPLHKVRLEAEKVPELARELYRVQHEPYGGIPTIAYYNLFKEAKRSGFRVLLDGQGMDEQWAGYDYYTKPQGGMVQGVKSSPMRPNVLQSAFTRLAEKNAYPQPFSDRLQNLQYRDLFYTKIPRALRFNDRASMAASVELREPFLDYRLVELAFVQPESYKIRNGQQKWLLRRIAQKYLGDEIALAPKRPLQTPQREWLGNELSAFVEEQIEKIASSNLKNWFDMDIMRKEWQAYKNGNQDNAFYIWQWVSVGLMISG